MKKTALNGIHRSLGGRLTEYGGWELPVQYGGIIEEHIAVRTAAGIFDVSHMGEIMVEGEYAGQFLQKLLTNDILSAVEGRIVYSPMCQPDGGVVDDLLVYVLGMGKYLLVVNVSNTDKDFMWMQGSQLRQIAEARSQGDGDALRSVKITDLSDRYAQIALQGPASERILQKICGVPLSEIGYYRFMNGVKIGKDGNTGNISVLLSRTGYTGEDGFEIYSSNEDAPALWNIITDAGHGSGLQPVGLGARDTLRFEACLPLYGNELSPEISPLEAGLGRFVKFDKPDFAGRQALYEQKQSGLRRKLIGFEMVDRGIARSHYEVLSGRSKIGMVTSGSYSPTLGGNLGMALVDSGFLMGSGSEGVEKGGGKNDVVFDVLVRGNPLKARRIPMPFYSRRAAGK